MSQFNAYAGQKVLIFTKTGHRYQGLVKSVDEKSLLLKDRYAGDMIVTLDSIESVRTNGG